MHGVLALNLYSLEPEPVTAADHIADRWHRSVVEVSDLEGC
ncbi:MAG: hypothetical protein ACUVTM_07035 [Candidatus Bathyarchaeia archaeon]